MHVFMGCARYFICVSLLLVLPAVITFGTSSLVATILMEGGSAHDLSVLDEVDVEERFEGIPRKDPATGEKSGVCVSTCVHILMHDMYVHMWRRGNI